MLIAISRGVWIAGTNWLYSIASAATIGISDPLKGWFENAGVVSRRSDGSLCDGREPLDLEALFSHLQEDDSFDEHIPSEARIGHVHLYIRDVQEAVDFYTRIIGFNNMGSSLQLQAAFVSAGGYHHHVGLNSWIGKGQPPAPQGAQGLRYLTVIVPDKLGYREVVDRIEAAGIQTETTEQGVLVRDPSQNAMLLVLGKKYKLVLKPLIAVSEFYRRRKAPGTEHYCTLFNKIMH